MDFTSIVLVQIAIFSCLALLLPTSRSNSSLKVAAIVVLIMLSMSWYFMPALMMKIGIWAWVSFVLLPLLLMRRLEALVDSSQFAAASRMAKWLKWLAPTDGMWHYHHLLRALAIAQTGQFETAYQIFDRYGLVDLPHQKSHRSTALDRSATALLYRSTDRWSEYISWVRTRLTREQLELDGGTSLVFYLRALAETGDLHRCIIEVTKLARDRQLNHQQLNLLKIYLLAYCGRVDAVIHTCEGLLSMYPSEIHQFWIGTAELAAGNSGAAIAQLTDLRHSTTDSCIQQDIDWRLSQPLPDLEKLSSLDWASIAQMESALLQDVRYGDRAPTTARTPITNLLIAVNVLVFGLELFVRARLGDDDLRIRLWGELATPLVINGQWWRIITANFLHEGILHLGMNMLALLYLGKFVEYRLGSWRYLLAYIAAGIGSMATITYISTNWLPQPPTIGASGAIMGMLGVIGAIHLSGWRQSKVAAAGRQFQAVLFSVGFQLVFDITNGRTSIIGHFSGLTIGFLVGLLLLKFGSAPALPALNSSAE
ncbi:MULTISPECIES: rhomboid family intramembrane serine protease [unclassified Chamaesiphon]|uniref:rhomboid family intramembrane serine protease n=1 Tax=unclassified Chamaesiphon TaxID=2620921 RepID=UPI00286A670A|nr:MULTISPECIES: rhomboid family intramembrane serine protease [unclassified Chamaesiphon]